MTDTERADTAAPAHAAIADRHGFPDDAVAAMREAIVRGGGRMAQFDHPAFGGRGQWMRGGMTMIGSMFDDGLKRRVDTLANDLADRLAPGGGEGSAAGRTNDAAAVTRSDASGPGGWPSELGRPSSSGSQNGVRYVVFDAARRLAVERDGRVVVYDTGEHRIGGISQQQGGGLSGPLSAVRFTSQLGPVDLASLSVVAGRPD